MVSFGEATSVVNGGIRRLFLENGEEWENYECQAKVNGCRCSKTFWIHFDHSDSDSLPLARVVLKEGMGREERVPGLAVRGMDACKGGKVDGDERAQLP